MNLYSSELLSTYWSAASVLTNLVFFANLVGALVLGMAVGYERSFHGRAAGMRTFGLVCTASCAVTLVAGYPSIWYGGADHGIRQVSADPTRVIQGVLTGVGFLGAGMITKEGLNISGLTTAASIWASSCIGILVGVGFYQTAILLALLSICLMALAPRIEDWLPSQPSIAVVLRFKSGHVPKSSSITQHMLECGYAVAQHSLRIQQAGGRQEWHYVATATNKVTSMGLHQLSEGLDKLDGVEEFDLSHAKN